MDISTLDWGTLLGSIAGLLTALLGAIKFLISTSNKPIHQKIDSLKKDTTERFDKIAHTLAIVEDNTVRKGVIDALRSAVRGYIQYNKGLDSRTKILIDSQCERLVEMADEMMNENFTHELAEQLEVKLADCSKRGLNQVKELFGEEFASYYTVIQQNASNDYLHTMRNLANDAIVNSKYARFKVATEQFLHTLVGETITLVHKWEKREKCVNIP